MEETKSATGSDKQVEIERKARVDAMWEQMNANKSLKVNVSSLQKPKTSAPNRTTGKSANWMTTLGLVPKKATSSGKESHTSKSGAQSGTSDEARRLAAAALSAAKDVATATSRGKIEITEVRKFAGEEIQVKKLVEADSKEAADKLNSSTTPPSGLDAILEQIKKKPKLSVLDKTKKDWGEFKEENEGLEEELDAYKKSSNQYLDKVSFLERTDLREFEREREIRLALQAKRRAETREDF